MEVIATRSRSLSASTYVPGTKSVISVEWRKIRRYLLFDIVIIFCKLFADLTQCGQGKETIPWTNYNKKRLTMPQAYSSLAQRCYKTRVNLKNLNFFKQKFPRGFKIIHSLVEVCEVDQNIYKNANKSTAICESNPSFLRSAKASLMIFSNTFQGKIAFQKRFVFYR